MAYKRDSEELREALRNHSVAGYPVEIKMYGAGTIVRQGGMGPVVTNTAGVRRQGAPQPYYVIRIDNPMPFSKFAELEGISRDPLTSAQWDELLSKQFKSEFVPVGFGAMDRIDAGESVSRWEATYESMYDSGQLDGDGNIVLVTLFPQQVKIPPDKLKYGMLVDVVDDQGAALPGRFWGKVDDGKVALIELFAPMPYLDTPNAVASEFIKPEFISEFTYALGRGTAETWELMKGKLPKGRWDGDPGRIYLLDQAIPLSKVEKLCKEYVKKNAPPEPESALAYCVWHSMILNILPLYLEFPDLQKYKGGDFGVEFQPLPEDVSQADMVVSFGEE
jgi:hypothetical protein